MIRAEEIKEIAAQKSIDPGVIEKDYILNKVLYGLSRSRNFSHNFVFKGGTAIKKLFYSDWRYSEDLDFTLMQVLSVQTIKEVFLAVKDICREEFNLVLDIRDLTWVPKERENPHYVGLKLHYVGPLMKSSGRKNNVRVDLSLDEPVLDKSRNLEVIGQYADDLETKLRVYSLEELFAEKLRSILQRGKSRDYYDVWFLLKFHQQDLNFSAMARILSEKCKHKDIKVAGVGDFFVEDKLQKAESFWRHGLAHQLSNLPDFKVIVSELERLLKELLVDLGNA